MTAATPSPWRQDALAATLVAALVLAAALFGILTRPLGSLAVLWPANALLLGLLVRFPALATPAGWLGGVAGYLAADLLTGSRLPVTLLLTAGNLVGVLVGYLFLRRLSEDHRRLRSPLAVLLMVVAVVLAAASAGCIGAIADPLLFNGTLLTGWSYWFAAETVNYIAFLPVMLSLPERGGPQKDRRKPATLLRRFTPRELLPVLALALSALLGMAIGGPGAVAFPVPALLWCALSYGVFTTAWLTLLFSSWTLIAISLGLLPIAIADINARPVLLSIRIGVSLIALGPITVSSVMAARNALLQQLKYVAAHDALSGLLNRGAFYERGQAVLRAMAQQGRPIAVLMLDIDHFKAINDRHGHAAGDRVLAEFAALAAGYVREVDVLGRIGGEEFSAVLPDCEREEALAIAERLRAGFASTPLMLDGAQQLCTVSIGAAFMRRATPELDPLLRTADAALYRAKQGGRNRVECDEVAPRPAAVAAPAV